MTGDETHQEKPRTQSRANTLWRLRTQSLALGRRTVVMGVVNITFDSFSDGGLFLSTEAAVAHALQLLAEGADLIDLGAESTRPGSRAGSTEVVVSAEEEQARRRPVTEGSRAARPDEVISVDTYKTATARAALQAGAEIINEVSGFMWEPELARVCAEAQCGVVLMHTRGRPEEWAAQEQLPGDELAAVVREGLAASLKVAEDAGAARESIVLDPGYGFGKRFSENFGLLARQHTLLALGRPLLAGVSRKSFLGRALAPLYGESDAPVNKRETASLAAMVTAILNGASIVRVHEVPAAVEAARIADAALEGAER